MAEIDSEIVQEKPILRSYASTRSDDTFYPRDTMLSAVFAVVAGCVTVWRSLTRQYCV